MALDYDEIAERYDAHRRGGGPYLAVLVRLARACGARRVLEIGPGTGNNTAAFVGAYPAEIVGLERSPGMLGKAAGKGLTAAWVRGDASSLPFRDGCTDYVFACYVLHHIRPLGPAFAECRRVLRPGGCAAFVTAPLDFVRRHPMNRYFPSFAEIDAARFQDEATVRMELAKAGFDEVGAEHCTAAPTPIDRAYADRVAGRFISTYDLLPPGEFEEGLRRLYADVEEHGNCGNVVWESLVIWGRRNGC